MRGIIVLCFSALAAAAPQGYNYPQVQTSASHQLGYSQSILPTLAAPLHQQQQQQQQHVSAPSQYIPPQSNQPEAYIGQQQQLMILSQPHQAPKQEVLVSKRFFIHSAPEEKEEELKEKHLTIGTPRKNYNVVFIRAPAQLSKKTSIKITPAANEDKTVIYVLSKKNDASEIDAQIQEVATTTTKPEVFFIKYKTPEEAAHAQQKIQAEYDHLGGSTQVSNEGIAPVTSVIGALEERAMQQQQQHQQQQQLLEQQANAIAASTAPISSNQHLEILPSASGPTGGSILSSNNGYLPPNYYY